MLQNNFREQDHSFRKWENEWACNHAAFTITSSISPICKKALFVALWQVWLESLSENIALKIFIWKYCSRLRVWGCWPSNWWSTPQFTHQEHSLVITLSCPLIGPETRARLLIGQLGGLYQRLDKSCYTVVLYITAEHQQLIMFLWCPL